MPRPIQELIAEVRAHSHAGNTVEIDRMLAENQDNKLFVSLVELQRALIPAVVQVWQEHSLLLD